MNLASLLPKELQDLDDYQTALPRIAKDRKLTALIESIIKDVPTRHDLRLGDSRSLQAEGVHLVLTSPPYWTLKEYRKSEGQLGFVADYEVFLGELDKVWERCHKALVPGGRLICVVGNVCLSRRNNAGRHMVMPLHSSIQEHCRQIGYDNLAPIIWHKIANAKLESEGNGSSFMGKPYEPNAVVRTTLSSFSCNVSRAATAPSVATRVLSVIPEDLHREWFQQIWTGLPVR